MLFSIPNLRSFVVLLFLILSGCEKKNTTHDSKKYSLYIMDHKGGEYLVQTNSLESDPINPQKQGVLLNPLEMGRELIAEKGMYYRLKKGKFSKYQIRENKLECLDSVDLKDFYLLTYSLLPDDSLLLVGTVSDYKKINYVKLETQTMAFTGGVLDLPPPFGTYNAMSVGFAERRENRLFVGYTYHTIDNKRYSTSDTAYLGVFQYPEMNLLDIVQDTRSTYPGVERMVEPGSFVDEKGDFYFLACPGVALGNNSTKPTGIYRIKATEEQFDTAYFFNISSSIIQNDAYSLYYLGSGKALVRSERKDLYSNWDEHWKVPHYEFYTLDLEKQTAAKLPLPLDKGTRRQCVVVEDNMVYISINSDTEGNYIWLYNKKTGNLKKGLRLIGDTDFILRLDKLY